MSRTATATPPPPFFPARNATPSMRHCSAPNVSAAHFNHKHHSPHLTKPRRTKNLPASLVGALSPSSLKKSQPASVPVDALDLSYEEISPLASKTPVTHDSPDELAYRDDGRNTPTPSMSTSFSFSSSSTPLATPASSRAPSVNQPELVAEEQEAVLASAPARGPWMLPNFGKMAKAVVTSGMNMGMPFAEKRKKGVIGAPTTPALRQDASLASVGSAQTTQEDPENLDNDAARHHEWAMEQQKRVTECARLCSQWPQSGYNQSKWGPAGSKHYYEPQSYSNPQHVASLMTRQAELERQLFENSAIVFSCRHSRYSREGSEETPSLSSSSSSQPSPATSMSLSANLAADLNAAMSSSMIPVASFTASPQSLTAKRSIVDLDELTSSMALDSSLMEVDCDSLISSTASLDLPSTRPVRAQSCGSKRPLVLHEVEEEDKRRKVDEKMVVDDAVANGVIVPPVISRPGPSVTGGKQLSASVPDLSKATISPNASAMFGHVVKTSDTHPIIISPFFPIELIETIAENMIVPQNLVADFLFGLEQGREPTPFGLGSKIDVPSLLLSFLPPQCQGRSQSVGPLVPSPMSSIFLDPASAPALDAVPKLGNLLLSSCPGKRLRMEGPVRGRGPVCRDLATDLKRIKNEGVGCLVCCLDDSELALLGVPWETYRQIAADTGLDVIRVPMPDGFTPVSLSLFDTQVSLIVTEYSMKGINVLIHCRGGVGRAGLTACAWAIKMGFVPAHPSLAMVEEAAVRQAQASNTKTAIPAELEHKIVMSIVERVIAMIRSRRGLKAIESFEQVQFLASYVRWLRAAVRE